MYISISLSLHQKLKFILFVVLVLMRATGSSVAHSTSSIRVTRSERVQYLNAFRACKNSSSQPSRHDILRKRDSRGDHHLSGGLYTIACVKPGFFHVCFSSVAASSRRIATATTASHEHDNDTSACYKHAVARKHAKLAAGSA
jgi:hypothetical protein